MVAALAGMFFVVFAAMFTTVSFAGDKTKTETKTETKTDAFGDTVEKKTETTRTDGKKTKSKTETKTDSDGKTETKTTIEHK
jgi:hypothetical protein